MEPKRAQEAFRSQLELHGPEALELSSYMAARPGKRSLRWLRTSWSGPADSRRGFSGPKWLKT